MPETWIDEHTGNETAARPAFRTELRNELTHSADATGARRSLWKIVGWSVAATAILAVVAVVVTTDESDRVGPSDPTSLSTDSVPPTADGGNPLRGSVTDVEWTVVTVDGVGLSTEPPTTFTLHRDGGITGFDGCNQYVLDLSQSGGWTLSGNVLGIEGDMGSTAAGCPEGSSPIVPVADGTQLELDASGRLTLTSPSGRTFIARDKSDTILPGQSEKNVAIGESVMAGALSDLESAGVLVDVKEGRGPEGASLVIGRLRDTGVIGADTTIVIQVGTNAPLTQTELDAIMAEVPDDAASVVFMTLHADIAYIPDNNELIRALPDKYSNVSVIDWDARASEVDLCPDGIHISCNGPAPATFYTNLILEALGLATI